MHKRENERTVESTWVSFLTIILPQTYLLPDFLKALASGKGRDIGLIHLEKHHLKRLDQL